MRLSVSIRAPRARATRPVVKPVWVTVFPRFNPRAARSRDATRRFVRFLLEAFQVSIRAPRARATRRRRSCRARSGLFVSIRAPRARATRLRRSF